MPRTNEAQSAKDPTHLVINERPVSVPAGTSVAAALMQSGIAARISVTGQPRAPLCAMGICMECCATVNGVPHVRTCQLTAQDGMQVSTI
jgi:predicted molibdopterin-dependent oxidoreductase YjgC